MDFETFSVFARVYGQTLGLAALFVLSGETFLRLVLAPGPWSRHPSFRAGASFFLGIALFLALLVIFAHAFNSARGGTVLALLTMAVVAVAGWRCHANRWRIRDLTSIVVSAAVLIAVFTVSNWSLWLRELQSPIDHPSLWEHLGSTHSGRYANYAIYIDRADRIPYIAQNMGQSILSYLHLFFGVDAPLLALSVWIPFSLTALTLLLFGLFRSRDMSPAVSGLATYFVMMCNIALSLVPVVVLDNGSPFAFVGYTDNVASLATYSIAAIWFEALSTGPRAPLSRVVPLPALLGTTWAWTAPQNLVVGGIACFAAGSLSLVLQPSLRKQRAVSLALAGASFLMGAGFGATQLGVLLPASWREQIGHEVIEVEAKVRFQPMLMGVWTHFSDVKANALLPVQSPFRADSAASVDAVHRKTPNRFAATTRWMIAAEHNLWSALRLVGFPLLGLLTMAIADRRRASRPNEDAEEPRFRIGTTFAGLSLAVGFAIAFGFHVGITKWWLARFLCPGAIATLVGGVLAAAPSAGDKPTIGRRFALSVVLLAGVIGPTTEFCLACRLRWIETSGGTQLGRLDTLVRCRGPFY